MNWKGHLSALRVTLFLAGCVLFIYLLLRLHPADVLSLLVRIGWHFVPVVAAYSGYELVRAAAFGRCIPTGRHPPYRELLKIRLYGEAVQSLTFTGPFLAQPSMAWFLRARGLNTADAFAATISEFLLYTSTSAALSVAGLVYLLYEFQLSRAVSLGVNIVLYAMSAFLLVFAYAIARRIYLIGAMLQAIARLPWIGKRLRINRAAVRGMEDLLFVVLRDRPRLVSILALEFAAQTLLVFELFVILQAIGLLFSPLDPFLIESATKFVSLAFFFIPMQFGVSEGTYALIFRVIGIAASAGFAVALARRLRSLLIAAAGLAWAFVSRN
jgi:Lysylphosphatidylglycerol synthase TM region